jgi:hypothetical protein
MKINIFSFRWNVKKFVEHAQGWSLIFKCQQWGKGKEKPSRTILIQMATMHSKLGISNRVDDPRLAGDQRSPTNRALMSKKYPLVYVTCIHFYENLNYKIWYTFSQHMKNLSSECCWLWITFVFLGHFQS